MPETDCTVTAICGDGSRYTMTVRAKSLYYAVLAYNAEACCRSSAGFPRPEMDTRFEVRLPDGRVFETDFRRASEWANRKAERDARKQP